MEPLSIVAISAAVGGAAGKLIEKAWDSGEKWLASYFMDHHPKAQEKARQNSLEFLNDLAQRVHQLEEEGRKDQKTKKQIETAVEDPDFSALLKDALIASSRTDNEDKHKILARIVSERLRCQSGGLVSLTSTLACNAVSYLTPKQMRVLGLTTFIFFLRPSPFPPAIPHHKLVEWYIEWLTARLSVHLPIETLTIFDYSHLESVSCIKFEPPVFGRDLKKILTPHVEPTFEWPFDDFIKDNPLGKQLNELWKKEIQRVSLTTAGHLIGVYVHDELTKSRTIIHW